MAKKLESTLRNMILSLLLISAVMAAALGFVYGVTKEPIEKANKLKEIQAVRDVLPAFDNDPTASAVTTDGLTVYTGTSKGSVVGYAVKSFTDKGFSGRFDMMVGFRTDGRINKIVVLEQKETPGLGSKMKEPKFGNQFNELDISKMPQQQLKVKKDGGTIDAITAATISSRAYCNGITKAYGVYRKIAPASADSTKTGKGVKK